MAVDYNRQYIGARYVPVFYNNPNGTWDWLSGVQYEPLTIVKYGTATYTSKQLVPAAVGAPNTAPEYWALTGDYNGAIVELQNSVNFIEDVLGNSNRFKNRYFLFIGDSYAVGYNPDTEVESWASLCKSTIESNGGQADISAYGGASFAGSGGGTTYLSLYNQSSNKNKYTDIVIAAGYNEGVYGSGTKNGLISIVNAIRSNTPNCRISYLDIGKQAASPVHNRQEYLTYLSLLKDMNDINVSGDINSRCILALRSYFSSDEVHPSQDGQNALAYHIMRYIIDGNIDVNIYKQGEYSIVNFDARVFLPKTISIDYTYPETGFSAINLASGMDVIALSETQGTSVFLVSTNLGTYWECLQLDYNLTANIITWLVGPHPEGSTKATSLTANTNLSVIYGRNL